MCVFCGAGLEISTTEYIEKQGNYIIVIKNIPCEKCVQCGEEYLSDFVMQQIENILNNIQRIASEITVTIIDYQDKVA